MVYMHAGEFHYGAGSDRESDMPYFAPDVVLVTFNYRIGVFGFLGSEQLRSRAANRGTGSYGMHDQRLVLRWVQRSIASFGGNASNVVLWGESSGGTSVSYHLTSAASHGLFHRAIMQSPGITQVKTLADAELNYNYLLAMMLAAKASPACVRSTSPTQYVALSGTVLDRSAPTLGGGDSSHGWSAAVAAAACDALPACDGWSVFREWHHHHDGSGENGSTIAAMRSHHLTATAESVSNVTLYRLHSVYNASSRTVAPIYDVSGGGIGHYGCATCLTYLKAAESGPQGVECLVKADAITLASATDFMPRSDSMATDDWAPTIDGVDTNSSIVDGFASGRIAPNVDVLLGSNLDEGTIFSYLVPPIDCNATQEYFAKWATTLYGRGIGPGVAVAYAPSRLMQPLPKCVDFNGTKPLPSRGSGEYYMAAMRSAGDYAITCRVRQAAASLASYGHRSYEYFFTATPKWSANYPHTETLGAFHGADVPFAFGDQFELTTPEERLLAKRMGCLWRNFAWSGDPNRGSCSSSTTSWPTFLADTPQTLVLGLDGLSVRAGLKQAECELMFPP